MLHTFQEELTSLADRVEQEFFRIERRNRWASAWINGLIAGLAVGLIAWAATTVGDSGGKRQLLLFACLGSSSASIVLAPVARTNSLRSIVLSYMVSAVLCAALFPLTHSHLLPLPVLCTMAVTLSVCCLRLLDATHPAAVGSALAFVIYTRDLPSLALMLLAIVGMLTIVKVLVYIYREELRFRHFPREFRRQYYGAEVTVAVETPADAGKPAPPVPGVTAGPSDQPVTSSTRPKPAAEPRIFGDPPAGPSRSRDNSSDDDRQPPEWSDPDRR